MTKYLLLLLIPIAFAVASVALPQAPHPEMAVMKVRTAPPLKSVIVKNSTPAATPHKQGRTAITKAQRKSPMTSLPPKVSFALSSPTFTNGGTIPAEYTCDGKDGSPALLWRGAPEGTKSFALIVDDPDAPNGTWVHWTVWNIAPNVSAISARSVPPRATEGMTSFGKTGYGGPCPPSGVHRYFFKLYALDTMLNLPLTTTARGLEAAMQGHVIKKVELMGKYSAH